MSEPFIGEIRAFPYNFTPNGWLACNGQQVSVNTYQTLFAVIAYTYGGSGQDFAVPDLRDRAPRGAGMGQGLSPSPLGATAGSASVALTLNQVPAHTHVLSAAAVDGELSDPTGNFLSGETGVQVYKSYAAGDPLVSMAQSALTPTGQTQAHENRQPLLTFGFFIAYEGLFPQRP